MTCFSISAFFWARIFLTGSANQKTKNGGGESGLRVNFNYLDIANTYNHFLSSLRCVVSQLHHVSVQILVERGRHTSPGVRVLAARAHDHHSFAEDLGIKTP